MPDERKEPFFFRELAVERPLRLSFQASPDRIARLDQEKGFQGLAQSKKRGEPAAREQAEGRAMQEAMRRLLGTPPRPLEAIENDIRAVERDIMRMLAEVSESGSGDV